MIRKILNNKEWLFSGIGVVIVSAVLGYFLTDFRSSNEPKEENKYEVGGNIIININITPEQLKQGLQNTKKYKSNQLLLSKSKKEKYIHQEELKVIENKINNIDDTILQEKKLRQNTKESILELKNILSENKFKIALKNLSNDIDTTITEQILDEIVANGSETTAIAAYQSALLAENRIDYSKAMERFKVAVVHDSKNTEYLFKAAQMARKVADFDQADIWLTTLLADFKKDKNSIKYASILNELAIVYYSQGKYNKAEPLYKRSLAITETALGKDHPSVTATLNNLAGLYKSQGKYNKAEPLYKRSLAITETALGKDHPSVTATLNNLAGLYESQGKYNKAEPLYKRSLAITKTALGKDHPSVATTLNNLALLYCSQGKYNKAEPLYKRSLAITETALGKDHPLVATTLNNLALLYCSQGKYDEAEPLYQRSLEILNIKFPEGHPDIDTVKNNYNLCKETSKKGK